MIDDNYLTLRRSCLNGRRISAIDAPAAVEIPFTGSHLRRKMRCVE